MSRLVILGAGPIGTSAAQAALDESAVDEIAAVVDADPAALARLEGRFDAPEYTASADLPAARAGDRAVVAISSLAAVAAPEIIRLVSIGYHVVTPCEELAWPDRHVHEALATSARSNGRVVITAGANPGFAMDRLPLMLAAACRGVKAVMVKRRVDTATHRELLPTRTGHGETVESAEEGIRTGRLGHVGLTGSARLIAAGLGWPTHDLSETVQPIIGDDGLVLGVHHRAELRTPDQRRIELDLSLAYGISDPVDHVTVDGIPRLEATIEGGYPGVDGTTAQLVRALDLCNQLEPGFYRPTDLPLRFG